MKTIPKELKDSGITQKLWNEWLQNMNELTKMCVSIYERPHVKMDDNYIKVRDLKIASHFVNCEFIEIRVEHNCNEVMSLRSLGSKQSNAQDLALVVMLYIKMLKV